MKKENLKKQYNITENQFLGKEKIQGNLYLRSLTSIPDGFNPTVGGNLDLSSLTSIPDGFNPTVGGNLYLSSLTSIPDGFNPTVGGNLYLSSLTSIPDGFNPTVGGNLYLRSLTSIPDGFNPTVGGNLDLRSLTSIPDGFNPTVGGNLDLRSLTSIPDGFNPTVGGNLDLRYGLKANYTRLTIPIIWPYNKYIKADGLFTKIVHQKGNVYQVKKLLQDKVIYLITDGNNKWAHGDTLKEARENLIYKIGDRDTSKFKGLKLDAVLSFSLAIEAYRTITGACAFGTKDFVTSTGVEKKSYTISQIIELTKGRYGWEVFKSFFEKTVK